MPTADDPQHLRARARSLRNAAAVLPGWELANLAGRAGPDTWVGPTPTACALDVARLRAQLTDTRDALLAAARRLEATADVATAAAALPVVRT